VNAENKNIAATAIVALVRSDNERVEIFMCLGVMMTFWKIRSVNLDQSCKDHIGEIVQLQ
jgi:uncharacterized membrane protein YwzB